MNQLHFLASGYLVVSASFVEKTFSPLNGLVTLVKKCNQL